MSACLDSWAVLAWLDGEQPAAGRIDELLGERPAMSWVNAVEAGDPEIMALSDLPCAVEDLRGQA